MSIRQQKAVRGAGFLTIPILGLLTPLLALPAISSEFGASGWSAVAIGQSVGTGLATIVELGWGLNGPQRVSRMSARNGYALARLSIQTKALVYLPLALVAGFAAYLISPSYKLESAVVALSSMATAFTLAWFFLGKSRPWAVAAYDGLPRLFAVAVASLWLLGGGPLLVFPLVGLLLPSLLAPAICLNVARKESGIRAPQMRFTRVLLAIRAQLHAVSARAASAIYISLPVALVGAVAPAALPVFAAGERIMRLGLTALSVVPSAMQGWVGRAAEREVRIARANRAVLLNVGVGLLAGLTMGLLGPLASSLIFAGAATIDSTTAWLFGAVAAVVCTSRATGGIALVAHGRIGSIALSATVGAAVGVPAILILARHWGTVGGVLGEILAESAVLAVQLLALRRARPSPKVKTV